MRLNKFLAAAGLGSRRGVEELISAGHVRLNGKVITDLATQVAPGDAVKVGSRLLRPEATLTAVLNKPRGYVCTAQDERGRRTIFDLLPAHWPRVYHVGRLDADTDGLLIVTNDGELSLALSHPRYKVEKEYEVLLDKPFDPQHGARLLRGFHIIGGRARMERVTILGPNHLRVTLAQGIKRQIRLMLYELGYEVERLVRVRIGSLKIGSMRPGEWRLLTGREIAALKSPEAAPAPAPAAAAARAKPLRPTGAPAPRTRPPRRTGAPASRARSGPRR